MQSYISLALWKTVNANGNMAPAKAMLLECQEMPVVEHTSTCGTKIDIGHTVPSAVRLTKASGTCSAT